MGIAGKAKDAWVSWDVHVLVLTSLLIQVLLIFLASFRKRTANGFITLVIWLSYLLADWVAVFGNGLITKAHAASNPPRNWDLLVLWSPFLLLHLGGPDAITALALEDNALWKRRVLELGTQVGSTIYVYYRTFEVKEKPWLWTVIILMTIVSVYKYLERPISLYLASLGNFRDSLLTDPDPGPNYAKLMDEFSSRKQANIPSEFDLRDENEEASIDVEGINPYAGLDDDDHCLPENLDYQRKVREAYWFFMKFRGLIVDLIFSFKERNDSHSYFLKFKDKAKDAFEIIGMELNFMYDIFYTKVVLHYWCTSQSLVPFYVPLLFVRFIVLGMIVLAALIFHFKVRNDYSGVEIVVTYILLWGAIALDAYGLAKLYFSEWTIASLGIKERNLGYWFVFPAVKICSWLHDNPWKPKCLERRWSMKISQYNLLEYCLGEDRAGCVRYFYWLGIKEIVAGCKYDYKEDFTDKMCEFLFNELLTKSQRAISPEITKNICSARGNWALPFDHFINLRPWILDVDYDESLLLWHIATEILFNLEEEDKKSGSGEKESCLNCIPSCLLSGFSSCCCCCCSERENISDTIKTQGELESSSCCCCCGENAKAKDAPANKEELEYKVLSRILSNYMVYLLLKQEKMVSPVADIAQIRFQDTCAEAKKFIMRVDLDSDPDTKLLKKLCKRIYEVETVIPPEKVKGDKSKSVLFDACRLAKELNNLGDQKWKLICQVWGELLSYAAIRCRPESHVEMLSKGGEMISLVWLLMAHMGLGEQFRINKGTARAKLIVSK